MNSLRLIYPIILFSSFNAMAVHECVGKVYTVDVEASGRVHVSIEGIGNGNVVCSLTTHEGLYTPESCKAAFSLLTAAKFSGGNVRLWFKDDKNTSCNKGSWIYLSSFGFYFLRSE